MTQKAHSAPPELPEAPNLSGDRLVDNVWDLRAHVAALRQDVRSADPQKVAQAAQTAAERGARQGLGTAPQEASQAATAAQEAAQAIGRAPSRALLCTTVLAACLALVLAGMAGWFGRAFVGPEIGLALPTCSEAPRTADSGVTYCIVNRP